MSTRKRYPFHLLPLEDIKEEIEDIFLETLKEKELDVPEADEKDAAEKPKPFQSIPVNQDQECGGFQPPPFVLMPPNLYDVDGASLEHLTTFWEAIKEVAIKSQAPGRMIVISALGTVATIVQGLYDVKSPLGTVHPASLNTIVIALSGERKTTVDKYFAKVFEKIMALINKKIEELNENFESELERWETDNKALKKAFINARKKQEDEVETFDCLAEEELIGSTEPTPDESCDGFVVLDSVEAADEDSVEDVGIVISEEEAAYLAHKKLKPQRLDSLNLIHDDFTIGAVLQDLYTNLPVASITTSEGAKVLDDATLKVIPFLNKLWDAVAIQVSRIVRGSFWLHDVRLSSSLMIQPDVMSKVLDKRHDELRSSGYFARALLCKPVSQIGSRPVYATRQYTEHLDWFHARLAEMFMELLEALADPDFKRKQLELDQEAEQMWLQFANDVESKMLPGGLYELVTDHGSKVPENVLRTAGVLHGFQFGDGKISAKTLHAAIQLCLQSSKDFVEMFNPVPQEERLGLRLKKYLYENYVRLIESVPVHQLYFEDRFLSRNRVMQCGNFKAEELNMALRWLQFQSYVRVVKELPAEGQRKAKYYIDLFPSYHLPPESPQGREMMYVTIN